MLTGKKPEVDDSSGSIDIPEKLVEVQRDTIYLSGPIRKADDNGRGWREDIIEEYSDEFDFINPLDKYDPSTHDVLNDPIEIDENSEKEQVVPSEYVTEDKIDINKSEYMFVGLPEIISRGTCMECMYAYMNGIPFFVWTIDGQKESGWIFDHAQIVSNDRDEVINAIENYE